MGAPLLVDNADLSVKTLGACRIDSPLLPLLGERPTTQHYIDEADKVLYDDTTSMIAAREVDLADLPGFEPAGPRRKIYFDPSKTRVGIVTCGGLCPGLNNVIRGLVLELTSHYRVRRIFGFRNGYQGFIARYGHDVVDLTPESVASIDDDGGTILGSSRGQQDPGEIVDCLSRMNINILFVIGGDGTLRGAKEISRVATERGEKIAVVGIPKTIDNDIPYIDQSFGFQTAFGKAAESIRVAYAEATSAPGGMGVVRLMGRHSGFIACYATLAKSNADVVLIPELPFKLEGEGGLLNYLRRCVAERGHAVVVVAEGAGQELITDQPEGSDASGNRKLHDVGPELSRRIKDHFDAEGVELNLKYIDPSYAIRSVPANPYDNVYTIRLAHAAVHAAMSGRTEMVVGRWRRRFIHIPIALAVSQRNQVDPAGDLWMSVLEATGQPPHFE
ncbi:ATP-dependent 6-phosphofructokinase [Candidatus Frankia alpina]|uniref:ATP-dependent 6-phosphofructokinase n=1 Tax=Candidatus Frankia alpina TaxID=2699483 RepID=A0A4S5C7W9_9ACTN|nr:ATP-dependent 6-phosphofructokinase [Candidatus Frankia alpina]THJ38666.1 ATP-dependent 6-phosphofructokinase [Candidatus Frankia alpina]